MRNPKENPNPKSSPGHGRVCVLAVLCRSTVLGVGFMVRGMEEREGGRSDDDDDDDDEKKKKKEVKQMGEQ